MAYVLDEDDELDILRYDLEQAERRLADMERGGPHRITSEPEWNRAVRRQRDKVRDLRGELAEMEGDDSPEARP